MIRKWLRKALESSPNTANFVRSFRDQLDRYDKPIKTPWGFTLAGHENMAKGDFEPEETRLIQLLLQEVDVLVNVGANVGYYCCHALSLGKRVIAVEPIARNVHYLLKNIQDNGWASQAEIYPVALSTSTDIMTIWGGGTGASLVKGWASIPESYVTQVPVLTLDRLLGSTLEGHRALILVDVEGAEHMLLQGATATLDHQPRPIWMMEVSTTEHQPVGVSINPSFRKTFELFFRHGYQAFTADKKVQPISSDLIAQIESEQLQLSTHNFIFR